MRKGRIHVPRVPQDQSIQHESERPELIFLALPITLP